MKTYGIPILIFQTPKLHIIRQPWYLVELWLLANCFPMKEGRQALLRRMHCSLWEAGKIGKDWVAEEQVTNHTFHDIHQGSHISFLDDAAVFAILHGVHTIHNLLDLRQLQVLHEVIVKDGLFYEILWPKAREGGVIDTSDQPSLVLEIGGATQCSGKRWMNLLERHGNKA